MKTLRLIRAVLFGACLFVSGLLAQQVAAPQLNPAPGPKVNSPTVTLTTATSGATIRYTLDGSSPTATTGTVYTGPILLNGALNTVRAIAIKSDQPASPVITGVYPVLNNGGRSVPLPTDRGRVQVVEIPDPLGTSLLGGLGSFANLPLKVLRTDSGQPLRGSAPWLYRIIENGVENPNQEKPLTQSWINRLVADRLNSVRICFWDAYDQAAGYGSIGWNNVDFNNPAQVEVLLANFERWADLCSQAGIYVAINYHNMFQSPTNEAHATAFWTVMARYFRDRTHLIFEITNEPAGTNWKSFDANNGAERNRQIRITKAIRDLDPDRFLLVLTPAGFSGGYQWASDLDPNIAARNFANNYLWTYGTAIDWTKTAVGYHNYYDPNGTSGLIRALHREFPAFWTETGLGPQVRTNINNSGITWLSDLEFGPTLDGDRSNIQTAEKLGIGWWQWTTDSETRQNTLWPFIQANAIAHNYWWPADTGSPAREPDQPGFVETGLNYRFFTGTWTSLPDFNTLTPVRTGVTQGVDLATAAEGATANFGVDFTGYINVPADGVYTFYTTSDDGSWLWIGNTLVVDNDGLHAAQERSGQINLKAGLHAFYTAFFQGAGGQTLSASWSGPGLAKQVIPVASLVKPAPFTTQTLYAHDFATGGQGNWWSYAGDGGVTSTLGLQPVGPASTSALQFTVNVTAPPATYWYGGTGVSIGSAFPITTAELANSYLSFEINSSSAITNGVTANLKDSGTGTLSRAFNVPGSTWTRVTLKLSDFTNAGFNFSSPNWQIMFSLNQDAGWGLGGSRSFRIANIELTRNVQLPPAPPAPVISSASSATAILGSAFSYSITASNSPTSFSATGLPAGLSLNTATGVISGTPTATGVSTVTLGATNVTGTGNATLTLTVNNPAPVISSATTATAIRTSAFSYTITASNTPTSFSATGLPAGLSLNTTTGVISGTPTATGVSTVTLGATNVTGTGNATLTLTVNHPAPVISSATTATAIRTTAFSYTITASNSPTSFSATGLPAGLSLNTATGVISGTPTATGVSTVTLGATNVTGTGNATLTLTVNNPAPVISSATSATAIRTSAFSYTITASNSPTSFSATGLPAGLSLNTTTGVISGTPTATGVSTVTLGATNVTGTGNATLTLTVNNPAPVISSATSRSGNQASAFTYTITASNSPTSFSATGLPAGLAVNTTTGVISGTPTVAGVFSITLGATNVTGTGSATLTLTLAGPLPVIGSATTATARRSLPFTYTVTASNSPTAFSATGLPAGLAINLSTGVISGIPTASGTFNVTLGATNVHGTATRALTLTVQATTVSTAYTQNFTAGVGTWWKYSGDGGVASTLTAGTFGPASSNALQLGVTVTAPPATYWYAGMGVSVASAFPSGSTTLDQCLLSLDLSSSVSVTGGVQIVIKDPTGGGTLTRTINAPGATWTRHDLTLNTFTNNAFNFAASSWEIMITPLNTAAWGLGGNHHLRVDNVTLIRATP